MMHIDVLVETALPLGLEQANIEELARFTLLDCSEADVQEWEVTILLTGDECIRGLHRDFMGLDSPTDVMTFPRGADDFPLGERTAGGDVVVSVDRATAQAFEYGSTPPDEMRFLVVHGLLHLCGWGDASDDARAAMHQRQTEILSAFAASRDRA